VSPYLALFLCTVAGTFLGIQIGRFMERESVRRTERRRRDAEFYDSEGSER
jgi:hypothetical protein